MNDCYNCDCLFQLINSRKITDREKLRYLVNYYNYNCSNQKKYHHYDQYEHNHDYCVDKTYIDDIPCINSLYFADNRCKKDDQYHHQYPVNNNKCGCLVDCRRPDALFSFLLSEAECNCCRYYQPISQL